MKDVVDQIAAAKDADSLTVHINTVGGDVSEGFAMYDVLKNSSKKVITVVEGLCASIGSVIFLAGEERQMTANSELMIHNPWAGAMGDADELQVMADQLKETESNLIDFYAKHTKQKKATLDGWMKEEKWMKPEEAISLGFATSVVNKMEVAASIFRESVLRKKDTSLINEIKGEMNKGFENILARLKELGGGNKGAKNQVYTTAAGNKFETDSTEDLAVGNKVIDPDTGKALEEGEHVIAGINKRMKVVAGKVEALEEVEVPKEESTEQVSAEVTAIMKQMLAITESNQKEIKDLKAALEKKEADAKASEEKLNETVANIEQEATAVFAQVRSKFGLKEEQADLQRGSAGKRSEKLTPEQMKERREKYKQNQN